MKKETQLWDAISDAVADVIPNEDGQSLVGDYVTVAEVMVEDGRIGVAVLTPEMTPRLLALLAQAVAQSASSMFEGQLEPFDSSGDANAA